ncbi:hypothetical protein N8T08_000388 [Aspergillus melleus]|uniref:Uncharacterized protein n=1 Tax=Aspergillus melleus TaxID=138277 RepID=A0ACC3BCB3_9EURO|nr:hypothetical protein N8T08_000388 [Aspergillus melleus]
MACNNQIRKSYLSKARPILNGDQASRSLSDCEIEEEDDPDESAREATEIQALCKGIRSVIAHLFKLSMIIRQNKPRGREGTTTALEPLDPTADMMHIRDRYEKARKTPWLIDRLGKTITARREYFRYRMWRQEEQCAQQSDLAEDAGPGDAHAATLKATTFDGHDMTVVLGNPLHNYSIEPERSTEASITSYQGQTKKHYVFQIPQANYRTVRNSNMVNHLNVLIVGAPGSSKTDLNGSGMYSKIFNHMYAPLRHALRLPSPNAMGGSTMSSINIERDGTALYTLNSHLPRGTSSPHISIVSMEQSSRLCNFH